MPYVKYSCQKNYAWKIKKYDRRISNQLNLQHKNSYILSQRTQQSIFPFNNPLNTNGEDEQENNEDNSVCFPDISLLKYLPQLIRNDSNDTIISVEDLIQFFRQNDQDDNNDDNQGVNDIVLPKNTTTGLVPIKQIPRNNITTTNTQKTSPQNDKLLQKLASNDGFIIEADQILTSYGHQRRLSKLTQKNTDDEAQLPAVESAVKSLPLNVADEHNSGKNIDNDSCDHHTDNIADTRQIVSTIQENEVDSSSGQCDIAVENIAVENQQNTTDVTGGDDDDDEDDDDTIVSFYLEISDEDYAKLQVSEQQTPISHDSLQEQSENIKISDETQSKSITTTDTPTTDTPTTDTPPTAATTTATTTCNDTTDASASAEVSTTDNTTNNTSDTATNNASDTITDNTTNNATDNKTTNNNNTSTSSTQSDQHNHQSEQHIDQPEPVQLQAYRIPEPPSYIPILPSKKQLQFFAPKKQFFSLFPSQIYHDYSPPRASVMCPPSTVESSFYEFSLRHFTEACGYINPHSVLALDIDNTLLAMPPGFDSSYFYAENNYTTEFLAELCNNKHVSSTLSHFHGAEMYLQRLCLSRRLSLTLSEPSLPDLLEELHVLSGQNMQLLSLTARDINCISPTIQSLNDAGLLHILYKTCPPLLFTGEYVPGDPIVYKIGANKTASCYQVVFGVVFCNHIAKGTVLLDLLHRGVFHIIPRPISLQNINVKTNNELLSYGYIPIPSYEYLVIRPVEELWLFDDQIPNITNFTNQFKQNNNELHNIARYITSCGILQQYHALKHNVEISIHDIRNSAKFIREYLYYTHYFSSLDKQHMDTILMTKTNSSEATIFEITNTSRYGLSLDLIGRLVQDIQRQQEFVVKSAPLSLQLQTKQQLLTTNSFLSHNRPCQKRFLITQNDNIIEPKIDLKNVSLSSPRSLPVHQVGAFTLSTIVGCHYIHKTNSRQQLYQYISTCLYGLYNLIILLENNNAHTITNFAIPIHLFFLLLSLDILPLVPIMKEILPEYVAYAHRSPRIAQIDENDNITLENPSVFQPIALLLSSGVHSYDNVFLHAKPPISLLSDHISQKHSQKPLYFAPHASYTDILISTNPSSQYCPKPLGSYTIPVTHQKSHLQRTNQNDSWWTTKRPVSSPKSISTATSTTSPESSSISTLTTSPEPLTTPPSLELFLHPLLPLTRISPMSTEVNINHTTIQILASKLVSFQTFSQLLSSRFCGATPTIPKQNTLNNTTDHENNIHKTSFSDIQLPVRTKLKRKTGHLFSHEGLLMYYHLPFFIHTALETGCGNSRTPLKHPPMYSSPFASSLPSQKAAFTPCPYTSIWKTYPQHVLLHQHMTAPDALREEDHYSTSQDDTKITLKNIYQSETSTETLPWHVLTDIEAVELLVRDLFNVPYTQKLRTMDEMWTILHLSK